MIFLILNTKCRALNTRTQTGSSTWPEFSFPRCLGRRSCKVLAMFIQGTCPRAARHLLKNVGSYRLEPTFEPTDKWRYLPQNPPFHGFHNVVHYTSALREVSLASSFYLLHKTNEHFANSRTNFSIFC